MGEELLGVGVDEGDRQHTGLGVVDRRKHLVPGVHSIGFRHAFLELRHHPVDERQVLFCGMIRGRVRVPQEDRLVSLWVEFDADDIRFFLVKDGEQCCGEVKDMSGSNEGDHSWSGKCAGISLRYASGSPTFSSIVDIQIDNIKYY